MLANLQGSDGLRTTPTTDDLQIFQVENWRGRPSASNQKLDHSASSQRNPRRDCHHPWERLFPSPFSTSFSIKLFSIYITGADDITLGIKSWWSLSSLLANIPKFNSAKDQQIDLPLNWIWVCWLIWYFQHTMESLDHHQDHHAAPRESLS